MKISLSENEQKLHERALGLSARYRRMEVDLVEVLEEIDRLKTYRALGYPSLFAYAVGALCFSESMAYAFITVARKMRNLGPLREALREQTITVAKASRIVPVLTAKNADELIAFARTHTTRETDQEVARLSSKGQVRKKSMKLSAEVLELIKRVQSVVSSKTRRPVDADGALQAVLNDFLERHDPVRKAKRAIAQNSERSEPPKKFARQSGRKPLDAREKHAVFARDGGRCTFIDQSGERCRNDRWIHLHHLKPVSLGGSNEPSNLVSLCSFHHELVHQQSAGQTSWVRAPARAYLANGSSNQSRFGRRECTDDLRVRGERRTILFRRS